MRNLGKDSRFPAELVDDLARLPGFCDVLVHEYVALDFERVVEALRNLQPIDDVLRIVRGIVANAD